MKCSRCNESTCQICTECDEPFCGACECHELYTTCDYCEQMTVPVIEDMALEWCAVCSPSDYIGHECERPNCPGIIKVPYSNVWRKCPVCSVVQWLEDHENLTPGDFK